MKVCTEPTRRIYCLTRWYWSVRIRFQIRSASMFQAFRPMPSNTTLEIFDLNGRIVQVLNMQTNGDTAYTTWDGLQYNGQSAASGITWRWSRTGWCKGGEVGEGVALAFVLIEILWWLYSQRVAQFWGVARFFGGSIVVEMLASEIFLSHFWGKAGIFSCKFGFKRWLVRLARLCDCCVDSFLYVDSSPLYDCQHAFTFIMDIRKKFGKQVRKLRLEKGLSQEARLAHEANLDRTYIPSIEKGERNVSITVMEKIAIALKVKISALLDE